MMHTILRFKQLADILPGDEILVDGESEYRTIQFIPTTANLETLEKSNC